MKGNTGLVIAGLFGLGIYLFRNEIKAALQSSGFFAPTEGDGGSGGGSSGDTSGWNPEQPMLPGGAYRYGFYDPNNLNNPALQTATADSPFRSSRTGGGLDILPSRPGDTTSSSFGSSAPIDGGSSSGSGGSTFSSDLNSALTWGAGLAAGGMIYEKATGGLTKIANMARGRTVPSQAAENIAIRNTARAAESSAARRIETSAASRMLGTEAKAATSVAGRVGGRTAGMLGGAAKLGGTIIAYSTAATTAADYAASAVRSATKSSPNLQNVITSAAQKMQSNPIGNVIMRAGSAVSLRPAISTVSSWFKR